MRGQSREIPRPDAQQESGTRIGMLRAVPLRPLAVIALALAALPASAHDTWLHRAQRQPGSGLLVLELGSGGRYPHSEFAIAGSRVADASCVDEAGRRSALVPRTCL